MMSSTAAVHESGNSVLMEMQGMSSSECIVTDAAALEDIVGEEEDDDDDDCSVLIVTGGLPTWFRLAVAWLWLGGTGPGAVCSSSRIPSSIESRVRLPSGSIALTFLRWN